MAEAKISRLAILYGSQTGNAEDMAKRIGLQAKRRGFEVLVEPMDDYPLKLLPKQKLVVFVCSTTGHGQEPENMKQFYNFIRRRDLPAGCLSELEFATYGLGDSSYAKFNYVSKILYKRLRECGARPLQELVASDEQHRFGCDGIIYPKLDELWTKLATDKSPLASQIKLEEETGTSHKKSYQVTLYQTSQEAPLPRSVFTSDFVSKYNIKEAICTRNERATAPDHFQDTRFLCFKSRDNELHYEPGDVCTIYPENSDENVKLFLQLLRLDPEQRFAINKRDAYYMVNYLYDFIPDGTRVEDLVRFYLDIQSIPKRSFFEHLWPFSEDELERGKLREFASTEGQEELYDYCVRPKRSILETLLDFPHTTKNIQFTAIFDLIPPIKPRSFSIASSLRAHPNEIHLIVGVVSYRTNMKKARRGLCSNYLARMEPVDEFDDCSWNTSSKLRYFIRRSAFKLPASERVPIVMIGPGLGIAPFRGFIEERVLNASSPSAAKCNMSLYFGCRHAERDFYFRQQLERVAATGQLNLRVAFSRPSQAENKAYVQDLLLEDGVQLKRLIERESGLIYVAGNSRLPEELRQLLGKLLASETGDPGEMERLVNQLEATNRIQYDCW